METENVWLGGQGFLYKAGRSYFLGRGQVAKLSWKIMAFVRFP